MFDIPDRFRPMDLMHFLYFVDVWRITGWLAMRRQKITFCGLVADERHSRGSDRTKNNIFESWIGMT